MSEGKINVQVDCNKPKREKYTISEIWTMYKQMYKKNTFSYDLWRMGLEKDELMDLIEILTVRADV